MTPGPSQPISILVAADSPLLLGALQGTFNAAPDLQFAGSVEQPESILPRVRDLTPDVVLLHVSFLEELLTTVIAGITEAGSKVLLIGGALNNAQILQALIQGAHGIIGRKSTSDLICRSVRAVAAGEFWVSRTLAAQLIDALRAPKPRTSGPSPRWRSGDGNTDQPNSEQITSFKTSIAFNDRQNFGLTKRELQIVESVVQGQTNKDVAASLGLTEYTIKHYLTKVFDKLGVYNRVELVLFAINQRLCNAPDGAAGERAKA